MNGFNPQTATPEGTPSPPLRPLSTTSSADPTAIAICGVGLRLPGGISDTSAYWDLLSNGLDARAPIPGTRYNISGFDTSLGGKGILAREGYFLDGDVAALDTSAFSLIRSEVEACDPQLRRLLEVVREALDDAGQVRYRGERVGCFVGTFGDDWLVMGGRELGGEGGGGLRVAGDMFLANRVSYEYDFKGPSFAVKTGCSASLVALHEACRAIQAGDATSAIVAGTSLILTPAVSASFTSAGILSPDASCKTFDAAADGFARAEAVTCVYIKSLAAALRDGNPVRAVVRGTGVGSGGRGLGLLSPVGAAQEALMRKVYFDNGLDPGDTAYVECHGTGTSTGDPIEANAVGNVFGHRGVYIGSVKPNVGHSEGSAGLSSLIKCVLALERRIIPPNIKFETPNPKIPFEEKKLRVPTKPTPFPPDRLPRISINSFGIGGTNAHAVIDAFDLPQPLPNTLHRRELLLLSANTLPSLTATIDRHRVFIRNNPGVSPLDVGYTLALRREKLPHRAFALVEGGLMTDVSAPTKKTGAAPKVFLVFSGQGAQWPGMGRELILYDEYFRKDIQSMDGFLQRLKHPPWWSIMEELQKPESESEIHKAEISQPLCTALQIALVNRLTHAGIKPAAVVGHSSGEIAAAYAVGAISMEAAMAVAYYRGYVTGRQTLNGGMAAIGLGSEDVAQFLCDGVVVACENSPESVTISGDRQKVLSVVERIRETLPDVLARTLKVDMAYHSHHMATLGEEYLHLLHCEFKRLGCWSGNPSTALFSSVAGAQATYVPMTPEYWLSNLLSPVLFSSAVTSLLEINGPGLFLEIGPHSTLASPLRQIGGARPHPYIPCLIRGADSRGSFLSALGRLFQEGVSLDMTSFYPNGRTLSDMPTYAWDHTQPSLWSESRVSREWRLRKFPQHPLLGVRVPETPDVQPQWRNMLLVEDIPWVADHKIRQDVVFPMAAYVATAGEAARQMTGVGAGGGYGVRHVVAHTALVLGKKETEIITALRRHKLTDSEHSEWFDFSISSYTGSSWVTHCEGQVRVLSSPPVLTSRRTIGQLPRRVSGRFYEYLAEAGVDLGPHFRLLSNASSAVDETRAAAEVSCPGAEQNKSYVLHPTVIDACFQLVLMANAQGLGRNVTLRVPTLIENMDIFPSSGAMAATAWSHCTKGTEEVECSSDGKAVLKLSGFHTTALEDEEPGFDAHAAARLEWLPDFDLVDPAPLFKPFRADKAEMRLVEELALLCVLETSDRIEGLEPCQPHFDKFRDWCRREIEEARDGKSALVRDSAEFVCLPRNERIQRIDELYKTLSKGGRGTAGLTEGVKRTLDNCKATFTGEMETMDVLTRDGVLVQLYNVISFRYGDFVRLLSHANPTLRILEVGAGTGGTTELILRELVHDGGLPGYSVYTFTDLSAWFFPAARERFAYAANMEYKVLDISKDPLGQDFQPGSYDLIVAANVVHATPSLRGSLENLNKLLKPRGILVLMEVCTELRTPSYIFGQFSGWWLGADDGRSDAPYVPVERWDEELRASGYTGAETVVYDQEAAAYRCCATIMSRRLWDEPELGGHVTLISCDPDTGLAMRVRDALRGRGLAVTGARMGNEIPTGQDVICCVDLETNFFEDISAADFSSFQTLAQILAREPTRKSKPQKTLWLMKPAQVKCRDPRTAATLGVLRTLRSETGLSLYSLEVDPTEENLPELVLKVFDKIRGEDDEYEDELMGDREFVVCDGVVCIGRYQPFSLEKEVAERSLREVDTVKALGLGKLGLVETLRWEDRFVDAALPEDHVEIECRAVGLNFRDVLVAMGVVLQATSQPDLGLEVSGVILRVGSKVKNLRPGDRVFAITPNGGLMSRTTVIALLVKRIPDTLSFEDAATIPVVFATALQGLSHLKKDQCVLIHSACGGVGLAAVQVARMCGAEIFATVGSAVKVEYLVKLGIPRNKIFSSRDDSFYEGVMRETDGRGVDVVLNSLSGALLHASWRCIAAFGTMAEIGKRDLLGSGKLDMGPFLENRTYSCFDGMEVARQRPEMMSRLLGKFLALHEVGLLQPLPEVRCFDAADAEAAFRLLQGGNHIGKVVITFPPRQTSILSTPVARPLRFNAQGSYLLTGGLGGLGRATATWLVERGARHLTFLSRSAGGEGSAMFIKELEGMGCEVVAVSGAAERLEDVERAVQACVKPIKGVLHLAMVLQDAALTNMTHAQWTAAIRPKVDGAWNLHTALLRNTPNLDFFLLASSIVTTTHQPGQANYAAANTFLEALCQHRHALGLPASVLGICPIRGVGFVAENPVIQRSQRAQGICDLGEVAFLKFLEHSLLVGKGESEKMVSGSPRVVPSLLAWSNDGHVVMGLRSERDLGDAGNPTNWRRDRRMGSYHNIRMSMQDVAPSEGRELKAFLAQASEDVSILRSRESAEFLAGQVSMKLCSIMLKREGELDIHQELAKLGVDSLMVTELRRWFRQAFELEMSVLEILGAGSLARLGEVVAEGLRARSEANAAK